MFSGTYAAGDYPQWSGTQWDPRRIEVDYKTADQTGIGTTLTAVTDLIFAIESGKTYLFEWWGLYQPSAAAANNGPKFDVQLAGGAAFSTYDHQLDIQSTAGTFLATAAATVIQTTSAPPAAVNLQWRVWGRGVCSASGTMQLRVATVSAGTLSIRRGSMGRLTQI
jgi:hypothetical protein